MVGNCFAYHWHGLGLHAGVYLLWDLDGQRQRRSALVARGRYYVLVSRDSARWPCYELAPAHALPKFGTLESLQLNIAN